MTGEQDDLMKKFYEIQMLRGLSNQPDVEKIEQMRLKSETDLKMMAQRFELAKLEHQWKIDDRDSAAHQAKLELMEIRDKLSKIIERL